MEKKLKLLRFWLIGIFVILAAAIFILYWFIVTAASAVKGVTSTIGPVFLAVWPFWLGMAVLFVVVYFVYRAIVTKKK
jgi:hypothetical protein